MPLKPWHLAKGRLTGFTDEARRALVVAMARDVISAALAAEAVERLVVVTKDPCWERRLGIPGVQYVVESPNDTLNTALGLAAAQCRRIRSTHGIVALTADLPALKPWEMDQALRLASESTAFVPDASGIGTTLLAAPANAPFVPRYEGRSREAHHRSGVQELAFPAQSGIRQDVDTAADLRRAESLGVGRHTSAALASRT